MNLKGIIKKVLDEQRKAFENLPVHVQQQAQTPQIKIGWTKAPQNLVDAFGIDNVKQQYESQGFLTKIEGGRLLISGWGLPLPECFMKTPTETLKYGAVRPVGCTTNCRTHEGVDYACPDGTPVYATKSGKITDAHMLTQQEINGGNHCGPGQVILVSGNYTIIHCHLSEISVTKGQQVSIGQQIGKTGLGHLHIEIDVGGDRTGIDNWSQIYSQLNPTC